MKYLLLILLTIQLYEFFIIIIYKSLLLFIHIFSSKSSGYNFKWNIGCYLYFLKKKFQPNSFHFFSFLKKFQSEEAILSKKLDFNCYSALLCITFISAITRPLLTTTSKGWFYKRVMLHVIIPPGFLLPLQTTMLVPYMHFCCSLSLYPFSSENEEWM